MAAMNAENLVFSGRELSNRTFYGLVFLAGLPLIWQSVHPTKWLLFLLVWSLLVVFIFSTSRLQLEMAGWQFLQDSIAELECGS